VEKRTLNYRPVKMLGEKKAEGQSNRISTPADQRNVQEKKLRTRTRKGVCIARGNVAIPSLMAGKGWRGYLSGEGKLRRAGAKGKKETGHRRDGQHSESRGREEKRPVKSEREIGDAVMQGQEGGGSRGEITRAKKTKRGGKG